MKAFVVNLMISFYSLFFFQIQILAVNLVVNLMQLKRPVPLMLLRYACIIDQLKSENCMNLSAVPFLLDVTLIFVLYFF